MRRKAVRPCRARRPCRTEPVSPGAPLDTSAGSIPAAEAAVRQRRPDRKSSWCRRRRTSIGKGTLRKWHLRERLGRLGEAPGEPVDGDARRGQRAERDPDDVRGRAGSADVAAGRGHRRVLSGPVRDRGRFDGQASQHRSKCRRPARRLAAARRLTGLDHGQALPRRRARLDRLDDRAVRAVGDLVRGLGTAIRSRLRPRSLAPRARLSRRRGVAWCAFVRKPDPRRG